VENLKNYLRYEIYSDELQRVVEYRSSKKEAIKYAHEFMYKYGALTVIKSKTGEIVFETHPKSNYC
jgi:hypothetical protein